MGVDRAYADPIASDVAQLIAAAYANVDRSITASFGHAQAVREAAERFDDLVA